jgi:hypothetical protein
MRSKGRISCILAGVAAITLHGARLAQAGFTTPQLQSGSTATITQTADIYNGSPSTALNGVVLPTAAPKTDQLDKSILTEGSASSTANAGVYAITGNNNLGIGMTTGTGITQVNTASPSQTFTEAANLDIAVNANWLLPSGYPQTGSFPSLTYQFAVGGNISKGGYTEFAVNLQVSDSAVGDLPGISFTNVYYNGVAPTDIIDGASLFDERSSGAFTAPVISGVDFLDMPAGTPFQADSTLSISGTIDFFAYDDPDGGSTIQITDDLNSDSAVPLPAPVWMSGMGLILLASARAWRRFRSIA